jgi:hypothetical protein
MFDYSAWDESTIDLRFDYLFTTLQIEMDLPCVFVRCKILLRRTRWNHSEQDESERKQAH